MLLSKNAVIAIVLMLAVMWVSFWARISSIDATGEKTLSQITSLERRMDALDGRVSALSEGLEEATASMNEMRPEVTQSVSEVQTMLAETLPAMRADLNRIATGARAPSTPAPSR